MSNPLLLICTGLLGALSALLAFMSTVIANYAIVPGTEQRTMKIICVSLAALFGCSSAFLAQYYMVST